MPNITATAVAKTVTEARSRAPDAAATKNAPTKTETKNAYWWKTPRSRGRVWASTRPAYGRIRRCGGRTHATSESDTVVNALSWPSHDCLIGGRDHQCAATGCGPHAAGCVRYGPRVSRSLPRPGLT